MSLLEEKINVSSVYVVNMVNLGMRYSADANVLKIA